MNVPVIRPSNPRAFKWSLSVRLPDRHFVINHLHDSTRIQLDEFQRENFTIPTVSRVSTNNSPVNHIIYDPESVTEVRTWLNKYAMLSSFGKGRYCNKK
jgi:hypothetical protein